MADKVDQSQKGKKAKVLSLGEQKKAVRGVKKNKGSKVVKSSLESPFALEWPNISVQEEEEVCQLFMRGCNGVQKSTNTWDIWYKIRRLPPQERNAMKKELTKKMKEETQCEGWKADLVMGYNSVMKAVERDDVVAVLVKKNIEPSFITKAFLPGCATKGIPLLPIVALDKMVQSQEGLGRKHSCLVIGLRKTVTNEENRFHPVYLKLCEILKIKEDDEEEEEGDEEEDEEGDSEEEKSEIVKECEPVNTSKLSEAEIVKHHLGREDQSKRMFIPPTDASESKENKITPDATGFGADFISIGSSLTEKECKPPSAEMKKTIKNVAPKSHVTEKSSTLLKDFIFLDAEGEHTDIPGAETGTIEAGDDAGAERFPIPKDATATETCDPSEVDCTEMKQEFKSGDGSIPLNSKKKRKRRKPGPEYKPAKIKKTMNDPNRKERISKI